MSNQESIQLEFDLQDFDIILKASDGSFYPIKLTETYKTLVGNVLANISLTEPMELQTDKHYKLCKARKNKTIQF